MLAPQNFGKVFCLLGLGAVRHDCGTDHLQRHAQHADRHTELRFFLRKNPSVFRGETQASVLLGPRDARPTVVVESPLPSSARAGVLDLSFSAGVGVAHRVTEVGIAALGGCSAFEERTRVGPKFGLFDGVVIHYVGHGGNSQSPTELEPILVLWPGTPHHPTSRLPAHRTVAPFRRRGTTSVTHPLRTAHHAPPSTALFRRRGTTSVTHTQRTAHHARRTARRTAKWRPATKRCS